MEMLLTESFHVLVARIYPLVHIVFFAGDGYFLIRINDLLSKKHLEDIINLNQRSLSIVFPVLLPFY
jgi:hypothetical protein